jgi:uracil-DNA glycosylase
MSRSADGPLGADAARLRELRELYDEIHRWASRTDPQLVPRAVVEQSLAAEVVLVGQALAKDTQRLSGLPYTFPDGRPSGGGRELAAFLAQFGHSIVPSSPLRYAHSIDLVPMFPGRKTTGSGDKKPTRREIADCRPWIERELAIIQPRVVVLLGGLPASAFLEHYAGVSVGRLGEVAGRAFDVSVEGLSFAACPIYHPSGAWQFPGKAPAAARAAVQAIRQLLD